MFNKLKQEDKKITWNKIHNPKKIPSNKKIKNLMNSIIKKQETGNAN